VARSFAAFTQVGRAGPNADVFDGAIDLNGYLLEGVDKGATELRLSALFRQLPAAVLKARLAGATKPARQRVHA
jgi:(1->4)-alpha-D-glucan 1-alpha-D-glucosylmutase